MRRYQSFDFFGQNKDSEIKLEEEFSDSFKLFCTQDYEIEVLQIFSRELLTDLEKFEGKFSIEFGGNDIFIYRDKILTKEKNIRELIKVVDTILEKSGPLINRLHDDFDSMREAYSNGGGEND